MILLLFSWVTEPGHSSLLPGDSACCSGKASSGRRWLCQVLRFWPRHFSPSHKSSFLEIFQVCEIPVLKNRQYFGWKSAQSSEQYNMLCKSHVFVSSPLLKGGEGVSLGVDGFSGVCMWFLLMCFRLVTVLYFLGFVKLVVWPYCDSHSSQFAQY